MEEGNTYSQALPHFSSAKKTLFFFFFLDSWTSDIIWHSTYPFVAESLSYRLLALFTWPRWKVKTCQRWPLKNLDDTICSKFGEIHSQQTLRQWKEPHLSRKYSPLGGVQLYTGHLQENGCNALQARATGGKERNATYVGIHKHIYLPQLLKHLHKSTNGSFNPHHHPSSRAKSIKRYTVKSVKPAKSSFILGKTWDCVLCFCFKTTCPGAPWPAQVSAWSSTCRLHDQRRWLRSRPIDLSNPPGQSFLRR